jgi:phosphatidylglycerol:prolipoprotein diacylglycerol transferase
MWPVLFQIPLPEFLGGGSFPIRMFGVMVILGFLGGTWIAQRRLVRLKVMQREEVFDFCFYLLAVGILGSRLLFVMQDWSEHPDEWRGGFLKVFAIWQGGLVWYGGFALSTVFAFGWLAAKKLPVLKITDALALAVALALGIGRFGCYFAGDDYGKPVMAIVQGEDGKPVLGADGKPEEEIVTDAAKAPWWAIKVPTKEDLDWRFQYSEFPRGWGGRYLHPVQLYMSLKNFLVLGALLVIASRQRRMGILTASYLLLYPVARFTVEFWRGDDDRGLDVLGTGLSFSQFFGIFVFLVGIGVLRKVKGRPMDIQPEAKPAPAAA